MSSVVHDVLCHNHPYTYLLLTPILKQQPINPTYCLYTLNYINVHISPFTCLLISHKSNNRAEGLRNPFHKYFDLNVLKTISSHSKFSVGQLNSIISTTVPNKSQ